MHVYKCASSTDNELITPAPLYFTNQKKNPQKRFLLSPFAHMHACMWRTHALSVVLCTL
jgi:hypothetical protein